MTPLEEIELEIESVRMWIESDRARAECLGPLFTARAIERLEATVRAIGVMLQTNSAEAARLRERAYQSAAEQAPERRHQFREDPLYANICQTCGGTAEHVVHQPYQP